jgi:hypothetical protein
MDLVDGRVGGTHDLRHPVEQRLGALHARFHLRQCGVFLARVKDEVGAFQRQLIAGICGAGVASGEQQADGR